VLEEAYELVEAIKNDDTSNICEELGDVLLHVVFHSQVAAEQGLFTIDDVTDGIVTKLIRRHPHVFGDIQLADAEAVLRKWDEIKQKEKLDAGIKTTASILTKANKPAPVLVKATKLQEAASKVGFDWATHTDVLNKADEELAELKHAIESGSQAEQQEEIGDLLFVLTNLARHIGVNPEQALAEANQKFVRRFGYVEARLADMGKTPADSTLEEMDTLWNEVRKAEKA
jgi:MazG family protein